MILLMKYWKILPLIVVLLTISPVRLGAQVVVGSDDGYDFDYLTPKTYEFFPFRKSYKLRGWE